MILGWFRRPVVTVPDKRPTAILPITLREARVLQGELALDLAKALPVGPNAGVQASFGALPGLDAPSAIVPALPLEVLDRSGAPMTTSGRGAPLGPRIWYDAICSYDLDARKAGGEVLLMTTLADVTEWLWGPGKYRPGRHLAPLRRALIEVDSFRVVFDGWEWRMVGVEALPTCSSLPSDPFPFRLRLPFESDRGALIDRLAMRDLGRMSAPAWRACIRLAYLWDAAAGRSGGRRVYAWRPAVKRDAEQYLLDADKKRIVGPDPALPWGVRRRTPKDKPARNWNDSRAIRLGFDEPTPALTRGRVPTLNDADLVRLGFDDTAVPGTVRRKRRHRIGGALEVMEADGRVVIDKLPGGWRILEPRPADWLLSHV